MKNFSQIDLEMIKARINKAARNGTDSWTFEDLRPLLELCFAYRKLIAETAAQFIEYAEDHEKKRVAAYVIHDVIGCEKAIEKRDRNLKWAQRLTNVVD